MIVFGKTNIGLVRKLNQDSYVQLQKNGFTLVSVCDGMGGAKAGEVASTKAIAYLKEKFETDPPRHPNAIDMNAWLKQTIENVNLKLYAVSLSAEKYHGMGTTMVAVLSHHNATIVANVGDSRIYTMNSKLTQITKDHTLVQEWIDQGRLSEKEAKVHPQRSVLTNVLAILPTVTIDLFELDDQVKMILCCSDGLHGYVEDETIETILNSNDSNEVKIEQLINSANSVGGYDNITVVLMAFEDKQ